MPEKLTWTRLRAVVTALIAIALALLTAAGPARAAAGGHDGPPVGPATVSPLGHPGLCWQGEGNGSAVTLQACSASVQGQLWTFNGDGVIMNGNGYCLQNGGAAQQGTLFLSFSGQCAGAASQTWAFSGVTNMITNPAGGVCAYPQGGADAPGAAIVGRPCGTVRSAGRWSFGVSRLTLAGSGRGARARGPAPGAAASAGHRAARPRREFSAEVTVANAAGAMTAYGATVWLRPPKGLRVTRLAGRGGLSGWACTVPALKCQGSLAGGLNGTLIISGAVTGRSPAPKITVHAAVTRTNEARRPIRPVRVRVRVVTVAASPALPGGGPHGASFGGTVRSGLIIAVLLVAVGIALAIFSRRRPRPRPAHAAEAPPYPAAQAGGDSAQAGQHGSPPGAEAAAARGPRDTAPLAAASPSAPARQDTAPLAAAGPAAPARQDTAPLAAAGPAAPARQDTAPLAAAGPSAPARQDTAPLAVPFRFYPDQAGVEADDQPGAG